MEMETKRNSLAKMFSYAKAPEMEIAIIIYIKWEMAVIEHTVRDRYTFAHTHRYHIYTPFICMNRANTTRIERVPRPKTYLFLCTQVHLQ